MDLTSPRARTILWASLMSDNEVLITNFLATGRWDYKTFASIMRKFHTTAVFNAAVGKGKGRDIHLTTVVQLILTTAKGLWLHLSPPLREVLRTVMTFGREAALYPFSCAVGPDIAEDVEVGLMERAAAASISTNDLVVLKKRLGGFYLLYTLFFKQPYEFETLIPMTANDYACFEEYEKVLGQLFCYEHPVWKQYRILLNRLRASGAFECQFEEDVHDIDHSIRFYLNTKLDKNVELLQVCKQLQDEHSHDGTYRAAGTKFLDYVKSTHQLVATLGTSSDTEQDNKVLGKIKWSTPQLSELLGSVMTSLKNLGDTPVLSRSSILGNQTTEKSLMDEAAKRKKRLEVKEKKSTIAQRYDRDIFGSQKLSHQDDDGVDKWWARRGRSQAAKNLWSHYIPEQYNFEELSKTVEANVEGGTVKPSSSKQVRGGGKVGNAGDANTVAKPKRKYKKRVNHDP